MKINLAENIWKRALHQKVAHQNIDSTWVEEVAFLYNLGISMEEAIHYLYFDKPNLANFLDWITINTKEKPIQDSLNEVVFSETDLNFWKENGYIVLKNAISKSDCIATQNAIWDFLRMTPDDSNSWYTKHENQNGLMILFSNHSTLNKNRESLRVLKAYEQLYESKCIYKTIDKVSFNPPVTQEYHFLGSNLHWDVSLKLPIPFRLQGLIYLSDCNEKEGCFHCVPGFHHQIEDWMKGLPKETNPRDTALQTLKTIPITGKAGDMVIWHQALPHCATPNYGMSPRMVQYLTYFPVVYKEQEEWI